MRTTLTLDDRALTAARSLAASQHISLGEAVSRMILTSEQPATVPDGFPLFPSVPGRVLTTDIVKQAMDDD